MSGKMLFWPLVWFSQYYATSAVSESCGNLNITKHYGFIQVNSLNFSNCFIVEGQGLKGLLEAQKIFLSYDTKHGQYPFYFMHPKRYFILQELNSESPNIFSLAASPNSLQLVVLDNDRASCKCDHLNIVVDTLVEFVAHIDVGNAAVLTEDCHCQKQVAEKMVQRVVLKHEDRGVHKLVTIAPKVISESRNVVEDLIRVLVEVKAMNAKIIIALCRDATLPIWFSIAKIQGVTTKAYIWIIVDYMGGTNIDLPATVLNFIPTSKRSSDSKLGEDQRRAFWKTSDVVREVVKRENQVSNESMDSTAKLEQFQSNLLSAADAAGIQPEENYTVFFLSNSSNAWEEAFKTIRADTIHLSANPWTVNQRLEPDLKATIFSVVSVIGAPFLVDASYLLREDAMNPCLEGHSCHLPEKRGNGTRWRLSCCVGLVVDMLQQLLLDLKLKVRLYVVEDGFYGGMVNGSWNGMVGDVVSKKADFALAAITINDERLRAVDFTAPFMHVNLAIATLRPSLLKSDFINYDFMKPLGIDMLISLIVLIGTGMVLIYFLENRPGCRVDNDPSKGRYLLVDVFAYMSGLTFQKDIGGRVPNVWGARVTAFGLAFAVFVVMTAYTAMLTASKVHVVEEDNFKSLQDPKILNPSHSWPFGTLKSSSLESYFKNSDKPEYQRIYQFMQTYNLDTVEEGIKKVASKDLGAFIDDDLFLLYAIAKSGHCCCFLHNGGIAVSGYGIVLPKGSLLREVLSSSIQEYHENGFLRLLYTKWFGVSCGSQSEQLISTAEVASISHFGGLIILSCIGVAISCFLCFCETTLHVCLLRRGNSLFLALRGRLRTYLQCYRIPISKPPQGTRLKVQSGTEFHRRFSGEQRSTATNE